MPAGRSWLEDWTSGKSPLLPSSTYEIPRWQSASSMTASIIPRPVVQSIYAGTSESAPSAVEQASSLHERQHELEADLQFLLDAQADGLVRGLEGGSTNDDRSSTGSLTPTVQSLRGLPARRKPMRRQPGLRSARKGIYNGIVALSALKDEELEGSNRQVAEHMDALRQIDQWEAERRKLNDAAKHLESSEETIRIQRLQQEEDALQAEIQKVETELMSMKARHHKLQNQIAAVENSVEAKLSSYSSSLQRLEEDIRRFLSKETDAPVSSSIVSQHSAASMYQRSPKGGNLDMAKQFHQRQKESIKEQRRDAARERSALHSGASLWKEVILEVSGFEKQLRAEMSNMSQSSSYSAWDESPSPDSPARTRKILDEMTKLTASLESKSKHAKEQQWSLLVAAIGAELDAVRKGREIVERVLTVAGKNDLVDAGVQGEATHDRDSSDEIHELDRSFANTRVGSRGDTVSDEDPDPELLFSKQDIE